MMNPSDEGKIIMGLLFVIFIIVVLYILLVEGPKQEKEKNDWIKNNKDKLQSQVVLREIIEGISNSTPPCSKCNSTETQIWDVLDDNITFRCISCKKKSKEITIDVSSNKGNSIKFVDVLFVYIELVQFVLQQYDTKLGKYLKDYLVWDFYKLRKGSPLYRGITFNSNPNFVPTETNYNNIKNDEPSRRISQRVMDKVWNRDGGKCVQCGSNEKLEFDHIIPFSKGGSNTYRNIQLLCEKCNRSKSNNIG